MNWLGELLQSLPQLQQFLEFLVKNPLAMVGLVILITGAVLYRSVQNKGGRVANRKQTDPESASAQTTPPSQTLTDLEPSTPAQASIPPSPTGPISPSPSPSPSPAYTPSSREEQTDHQPYAPGASDIGTVNNTVTIGGRNNTVGNITQGGKINGK